jgi:hypothetical protein
MPSLNKNRIRLLGLSPEKAMAVVLQTGHGIFTEEAAHALIQSLVPGSRDGFGASEHTFESATVPPSILSLLCHDLNEKRLALGLAHVDVSLVLQAIGKWLESFYEDAFHDFSPSFRHWVEDELVTGSGLRDSISQERAERDLANRGTPPTAIDALVQSRLLSISAIGGIPRVELAHDLFASIALESRNNRAGANTIAIHKAKR